MQTDNDATLVSQGMSNSKATISIAICVATYKRPNSLRNLLESLRHLDSSGIELHLIIADNDPKRSAEDVVNRAKSQLPFPVTYMTEQRRGIVFARNTLVSEAKKTNAGYIAFVDDDETVTRKWLKNLLLQMSKSHADAVAGPQVFIFEETVPECFRSGLELKRFPSGNRRQQFSTGNVLIRTEILDSVPGPFDARFNLTGGEDAFLSYNLSLQGFTIVYCDEAVVYENVPSSRANLGWILKRGYRTGAVTGRIARQSDHPIRSVARHGLMSLARIIVGLTTLVIGLFFNRRDFGKNVRQVANGIGGIVILLAPKALFEEYRTIHGN